MRNVFRNWYYWKDRVWDLVLMSLSIALVVAVVTGYGWLTATHLTTAWWISAIIVNVLAMLLGAFLYYRNHQCERRLTPHCTSCAAAEEARKAALAGEKTFRDIAVALVYGNQDQLDELLRLFGERVQVACQEEDRLNHKDRQPLSPQDQLRRQKLRTLIGKYHTQFDQVRCFAPTFGLIVSDGWSAYFPEKKPDAA